MRSPNILIVEARYYTEISDMLLSGATAALQAKGATFERATVFGAFEIPGAIRAASRSWDLWAARRRFDGFIALGCVIRGETTHYDYVCGESARGLMGLSTRDGLAIGYGILTTENWDQAVARAAVDQGNKGADAVEACFKMLDIRRRFSVAGA